MEHNVGRTDAGIRWLFAAAFFALSLGFTGSPILGFLAAVMALVMVATALMHTCPLYRLVGLSTCPRDPIGRPG